MPQVLGPQPGGDGAHDVAVGADVDAAQVGPDLDQPAGHGLVQPDRLSAVDAELPAGWHTDLELHPSARDPLWDVSERRWFDHIHHQRGRRW